MVMTPSWSSPLLRPLASGWPRFASDQSAAAADARRLNKASKVLSYPLSDTGEVPARPRHRQPRRGPSVDLLHLRELRVDEQPDRGREGWSARHFRHPRNPKRPAEANIAGKDPPGRLGKPGQLAGAAGQNHAAADQR